MATYFSLRGWRQLCLLCVIAALHFCALSTAYAQAPKRVLVLYENSRLLPANIEGDRGFNEVVASSGVPVDVRAEFLDYPDFRGNDYVETVSTYLHEKYRNSPNLISSSPAVPVRSSSSWPIARSCFPSAPIVYMGVPKSIAGRQGAAAGRLRHSR